jgi:hypothetical protein
MGMISILIRVTNEQLEDFLENSARLEEYVNSEDMENNETKLDLDKSWDGINYILTNHGIRTIQAAIPPLSWVIFSGQELDVEQDMGYGPAQYLKTEQVTEVYRELAKISRAEFRNKYDHSKMNDNEVYPSGWQDSDDEKDYLADNFEELKKFYSKAVQERQAIITFLT